MSFLLKIVEGPNKGAEIALVEGVAVTLGKGDDCDIVLADATLPGEPLSIEASADGVTVGGEPLAPFAVKTLGATSFAVGPADAPWGPLEWPKAVEENEGHEPGDGKREDKAASDVSRPASEEASAPASAESPAPPHGRPRRRLGRMVALAVSLLLLILLLACLVRCSRSSSGSSVSSVPGVPGVPGESGEAGLSSIAERYGLTLDGGKLTGNFATRRERLAATAELYASRPGVDLDLSDDESFRTACEDALFTLTEGEVKVLSATNRVLALTGTSPSPDALARTLAALRADLPKLRDVDASGVSFPAIVPASAPQAAARSGAAGAEPVRRPRSAAPATPALPVCGILTSPYPCLVMRDGRRLMEGASVGDGVILEIGADSVVVTNSAGRFTWRP